MKRSTQELRDLHAAATKGPWRWWTSNSHQRLSSDATGKDGDVLSAYRAKDGLCVIHVLDADANLIVAAVNELPALLDEVETLRAENAKLHSLAEAARMYREAMPRASGEGRGKALDAALKSAGLFLFGPRSS